MEIQTYMQHHILIFLLTFGTFPSTWYPDIVGYVVFSQNIKIFCRKIATFVMFSSTMGKKICKSKSLKSYIKISLSNLKLVCKGLHGRETQMGTGAMAGVRKYKLEVPNTNWGSGAGLGANGKGWEPWNTNKQHD